MIRWQRSMFDGKKHQEYKSLPVMLAPQLLILNQGLLMYFVGLWSGGIMESAKLEPFFSEKRFKESYDPSVNPPRHLPDFGQILEAENLGPLLFAMQFWHGAVYKRLQTHGQHAIFKDASAWCSWHIKQKHEESNGYTCLQEGRVLALCIQETVLSQWSS